MAASNNILRPLSRVGGGRQSRAARRRQDSTRARNFELLMLAQQYWTAMDRFRRERERNKRYLYGDQWGDRVQYKGERITEAALIAKQGNVPLKNNLIRRLVRSVIGLNINQNHEPTVVARDRAEQRMAKICSTLLQECGQVNELKDLRTTEMEEFLISGLVVERKWYGWQEDKMDCWTTMVQPNNFIIDNNMVDPRGWDCGFVGELHDISFEELCTQFARSEGDYQWLQEVYAAAMERGAFSLRWTDFGYAQENLYNYDFFCTADHNRCRVIEIWQKESKRRYRCHDWNTGEVFKIEMKDRGVLVDAENARRLRQAREVGMPTDEVPLIDCEYFVDSFWKYYFLSPFGDVLDEGETPYDHKGHPYVFKAHPFIDGEIHSFVNDVIDQQRFINRLIIMNDMAIRSSAKGLMMVPLECIPDGMDPATFAEESTAYNGVLFYRSKNVQHVPTVITSNATNIGTTQLLELQMKLMEDISGVHGALQGQNPVSGTSGTLYAQQTENASTNLVGILMAFSAFVRRAAVKDMKNILQYYDDKKIENIAGELMEEDITAARIRDLEWDMAVEEGTTTAVYRQVGNALLVELWRAGQISTDLLLQNGDFPNADELLQGLQIEREQQAKAQQEAMAQQAAAQQGQQGAGGQGQVSLSSQALAALGGDNNAMEGLSEEEQE